MLALMYLLVWSRDRRSWASLCFSVVVLSVLGLAITEFLTAHGDIPTSVQAIKGGAEDFLTKPVPKEKLLAAVQRALTQDAATSVQDARRRQLQRQIDLLTPREREVLALVIAGKLNKEIAAELNAAENTIKVHRASIMEKLQARSPAELGRLVQETGWGGKQ